jgi:hypothetical protein
MDWREKSSITPAAADMIFVIFRFLDIIVDIGHFEMKGEGYALLTYFIIAHFICPILEAIQNQIYSNLLF